MTVYITLICGACKKEFKTRNRYNSRPVQRFCSSQCWGTFKQQIIFCKRCGKQIRFNPKRKATCKHYCSRDCSIASRKEGITEEHKKHISEGKKGKPMSEHHRAALTGCPKINARGELHHSYRDGGKAHNEREIARHRTEYVGWRRAVMQRDAFTCQHCGKIGCYLEVDHIKPWSLFPELRYETSNGLTLCKDCHRKTPTYGRKSMRNKESI